MFVFISYSHDDRAKAAEVHALLEEAGIESFMAHEHIAVSKVWRTEIMSALAKCDAFICLLSERFFASAWCVQETGIASFREAEIGIIPLSLDGAVSKGCFDHIQSPLLKVRGGSITWRDLAPGFATFVAPEDLNGILITWASKSSGFRDAEARLDVLMPYVGTMNERQLEELLTVSAGNPQIWDAGKCRATYLPQVMKRYDELSPFEPDSDAVKFIREQVGEFM